jgi:hypothetical protein
VECAFGEHESLRALEATNALSHYSKLIDDQMLGFVT